jgi:hypothetical protein
MAADGQATWFDDAGGMRHFPLKKLLRLGSHSALASAGAGISVRMGLAFQRFIQQQAVEDIDDIARKAFPFFSDQYAGWHPGKRILSISSMDSEENSEAAFPLAGVYFILAGYSFQDRKKPYRIYLLGGEEDRLRIFPPSPILVMPRSLSLERTLEMHLRKQSSLEQLLSLCRSFLRKRSAEEGEVGPPFSFATITASGFREFPEGEVGE